MKIAALRGEERCAIFLVLSTLLGRCINNYRWIGTDLKSEKARFTAISLFTGAGGLDIGLEAAGFKMEVAVEMDPECVITLRKNRDWPVIERSIHEIPSPEILKTAKLGSCEVDLLVGGPPCQPFSKSGYWANGDTKRLHDPRATTLEAFLRVLHDTQPRSYLLENVAGLAYSKKDEGLRLFVKTIRQINKYCHTNYTAELLILNAVDFGVPQIRERAFLIGSREGIPFGQILPTHHPLSGIRFVSSGNSPEDLPIYRTAWDALWDLEENGDKELITRGKWADLLPSIPEGQNYLFHTDRGKGLPLFGWRTRFWNFLLKLAKALPSWTITASPGPATGPFHWKNRRLSVRELCRLQTIPDDFNIIGSYRSALRQIGNAVPSALAERIGLEIRARLLEDNSARALKPTLIPQKQKDVPPPESVQPVPLKYRQLIGKYEPHPGTGKGPQALKQKQRKES